MYSQTLVSASLELIYELEPARMGWPTGNMMPPVENATTAAPGMCVGRKAWHCTMEPLTLVFFYNVSILDTAVGECNLTSEPAHHLFKSAVAVVALAGNK